MCSADIGSKPHSSCTQFKDDVHSWYFMYDETLLVSEKHSFSPDLRSSNLSPSNLPSSDSPLPDLPPPPRYEDVVEKKDF